MSCIEVTWRRARPQQVLTLSKKKLAFEVSNFPSWKLPNEIVRYDTYIIFKENLGVLLFVKNTSKNINTF